MVISEVEHALTQMYMYALTLLYSWISFNALVFVGKFHLWFGFCVEVLVYPVNILPCKLRWSKREVNCLSILFVKIESSLHIDYT